LTKHLSQGENENQQLSDVSARERVEFSDTHRERTELEARVSDLHEKRASNHEFVYQLRTQLAATDKENKSHKRALEAFKRK
jgi:hypothetical protein